MLVNCIYFFSKNYLLVSLFSTVLLVSIAFISTLIFVISFYLLTWSSFSPFPSSLKYKFLFFFFFFYFFLSEWFIAMDFYIELLCLYPINFGVLYFHCCCSQGTIWVFFDYFVGTWLFNSSLFNLHISLNFPVSFF